MTNSERRVTYMPKLAEPPGEALPDWKIISLFAYALGFGANFMYQSAEEIFAEFVALTEGTLCDISGASYTRLKSRGPVQWPYPKSKPTKGTRLYENGRFATADGKAAFIAVEHAPPVESPDDDYPLILTTGRLKHHWHTMTRTGKNAALRRRAPDPVLRSTAPTRAAASYTRRRLRRDHFAPRQSDGAGESHRRDRPGHMFSAVSLEQGRRLFQSGE